MSIRFTEPYCIADPLTESSTGMLAFPWIARDHDGTLVMVYHDGRDAPGGGAHTTRLKTSTDLGVTWSAGPVVWDDGIDTVPQISILSNGDWLMVSQGYHDDVPAGVFATRSTDRGATWSPTWHVTNKAVDGGDTYTSTPPYELASGVLLWPVYGPTDGVDSAVALVSHDMGDTWNLAGTIADLPGGVGASEVTVNQLADGSIVGMVRCTDDIARRTVSTDDGATWSTPVPAFDGCASRIDWIKLVDGRCLATWRDPASGAAMAAYSDDDMVSVTDPVRIHVPDKRTSYSALVEVRPGQVFAALGEIDRSESHGRIMARYLLDDDAPAPTGQRAAT
jgi:hypothetical protein